MSGSHFAGPVYSMGVPLPIVGGIPCFGTYRVVDAASRPNLLGQENVYPTITLALAACQSGDVVLVLPGSYDEAVTVTQSNIAIIGCGNRGTVAIVPSTANATALKIQGTATRTSDVTIVNIGCETNGTGIGLHVLGNTRRIRVFGGKIEGGTDAMKLESDATGSVADTSFQDIEFCWATNGIHITASGGGDPVTQTFIKSCFFHNIVTDVITTSVAHTADLWLIDPIMANQEDGTEPTQFLDLDEASTTGLVIGGRYATTVYSTAKFGLATGVLTVDWKTEREMDSTDGGTNGRPD